MTRTGGHAALGIDGLDEILGGGLPRGHLYLVEGHPGAGKTTLALQYLMAGRDAGETTLYITLSETTEEIRAVAASHGWNLDGVQLFELSALEEQMRIDAETTMFHPAEVQLTAITKSLLARVDELRPTRVVFDSLSEMRLLAQNPLRYRREVLALKQYFATKHCTVLLLDDKTADDADGQVQSLAHGVIALEHRPPELGGDRRRIRVCKLRGVNFRTGYHDFAIMTGGLRVFPRLVAAEHHEPFERDTLSSGIVGLDNLIGGGIDRGTSTLIAGPAGTGKSSIAAAYATAAARRGERAAIFAFDELRQSLVVRADVMGLAMSTHLASGNLVVRQIDPVEMSTGELVTTVQQSVERSGVRLVVIDSLNGLLHAMPEDRFLFLQLHELLAYLGQRGVTTILVSAHAGMLGPMSSQVDASYIADSVVLLRFFEAGGRVRKAISVVKKRSGRHEDTIRELTLDQHGVHVGEPLADFRGVLTGVPQFVGVSGDLRR